MKKLKASGSVSVGRGIVGASRAVSTAAQRKARAIKLGDLKPTYQTTAGKRRLSGEQAYLRRTTDSSRARVAKRYGLTAQQVARLNKKAGVGGQATFGDPKPGATGTPKPQYPANVNVGGNTRSGVRRRRRRRPSTGGVTAPS